MTFRNPSLLLLVLLAVAVVSQPQVVVHTVVDTFTRTNPFSPHATPNGFTASCEATGTFSATQHLLADLQEPLPVGLASWADALRFFFGGRPFPGSWDGVDAQGVNRDVIKMEWRDLPERVRGWIRSEYETNSKDAEGGDGKWLFGVYEKPRVEGEKVKGVVKFGETKGEELDGEVGRSRKAEDWIVLFAAGAVYEILPLWVAEGSGCEAELLDLERYRATPKDKCVVAWVTEHTQPDYENNERDIKYTIKAQLLRGSEDKADHLVVGLGELLEATEEELNAGENQDAPVIKDEL